MNDQQNTLAADPEPYTDFDKADLVAARIAREWTDMRKGATLDEVLTVVDAYQQTRVHAVSMDADHLAVQDVLRRCESGEEAEHVDMMDGSEGTYKNSFEEGVRFVCDRLRMLADTQEGARQ